ncbi:hypothetical protein [Sphingomonas sanxanigenens]|uniref:Uncharacterized protein n=1 Tax=Sphingomonas sanxanigenens DSM 19645 = NX02 TaxID=1123269 RepID=W0AHE3_9SPHN|nr:hypothetical protein [Sphingomonas sanxanigenens]AHE57334.1 hypothetical protein NX02_28795 [Sphingomonas sanxanigenens DSM 19645 = NX02]
MSDSAADKDYAMVAAAADRLIAEIAARGSEVVAQIAAQANQAINDKTVFVDTVTKERATWRSELRGAAASLIALLRASGVGSKLDLREIHQLRAEIILRLNPAGRSVDQAIRDKHPHDRDLHMILDELWTDSGTPREAHTELAARLERSVQELLKQEWSVSKREAITGEIAGGDTAQPAAASEA